MMNKNLCLKRMSVVKFFSCNKVHEKNRIIIVLYPI